MFLETGLYSLHLRSCLASSLGGL